jgi:hypothetical protein
MARVTVGQTLHSVTDTTTVIVIRGPVGDADITCGGAAMVDPRTVDAIGPVPADPAFTSGTLLGKRYEDIAATIELLCTKGGPSSLALNGELLVVKSAKPLPASD